MHKYKHDRQTEASERQSARDARTTSEQLALIGQRPGQSARETAQLLNRHEQGRDTIWNCLCGEQLEFRRFADGANMSATTCGNCGTSWWITWKTGALNHGTMDEALTALREV